MSTIFEVIGRSPEAWGPLASIPESRFQFWLGDRKRREQLKKKEVK
jgi:hypothetical protein